MPLYKVVTERTVRCYYEVGANSQEEAILAVLNEDPREVKPYKREDSGEHLFSFQEITYE